MLMRNQPLTTTTTTTTTATIEPHCKRREQERFIGGGSSVLNNAILLCHRLLLPIKPFKRRIRRSRTDANYNQHNSTNGRKDSAVMAAKTATSPTGGENMGKVNCVLTSVDNDFPLCGIGDNCEGHSGADPLLRAAGGNSSTTMHSAATSTQQSVANQHGCTAACVNELLRGREPPATIYLPDGENYKSALKSQRKPNNTTSRSRGFDDNDDDDIALSRSMPVYTSLIPEEDRRQWVNTPPNRNPFPECSTSTSRRPRLATIDGHHQHHGGNAPCGRVTTWAFAPAGPAGTSAATTTTTVATGGAGASGATDVAWLTSNEQCNYSTTDSVLRQAPGSQRRRGPHGANAPSATSTPTPVPTGAGSASVRQPASAGQSTKPVQAQLMSFCPNCKPKS